MKNQNRVRREGGSKLAGAQAQGQGAVQSPKSKVLSRPAEAGPGGQRPQSKAGASPRSKVQSPKSAGAGALRTYRVFTAAAGETDMTRWQFGGRIQARSPLDAARRQLREFKRLAVCRFNQGERDFIFELDRGGSKFKVQGSKSAPAVMGPPSTLDPRLSTAPAAAGVTVVFYSHERDEKIADVAFTAAEFAAIQEAARRCGSTLEAFFLGALAERLSSLPPRVIPLAVAPAPSPLAALCDRLATANREVRALETTTNGMLNGGEEWDTDLVAGLHSLSRRTHADLVAIEAELRPLAVAVERRAA